MNVKQKHRQMRRLRMRKQAEEVRASRLTTANTVGLSVTQLRHLWLNEDFSLPASAQEREH